MTAATPKALYALGYTSAEHDRLARQAAQLAPVTERLFRDAGLGPSQRVLDVGSGAGDVAMLVARLVGPAGEVVGIERDPGSIAVATNRVAAAGFTNVRFTETDISEFSSTVTFDAAVGRFILMWLPDPIAALRAVAATVRPGGVLAFQEPSWIPLLALTAHLPLWSVVVSIAHDTILRAGGTTEMGLGLYRVFQQAGLPAPTMYLEMPLGTDRGTRRWVYDLLGTLRPRAQQLGVSLDRLGDWNTLAERMDAEIAASGTVVGWPGLVAAWARKPAS